MAFQQGLSGLSAASKAIDITSNNIANASTVGFKASAAHFADVYAASLSTGGASGVGIGTSVAAIAQQFTQGNVSTTNNPLDLAINGQGFFRMVNDGEVTYTRNGQFSLDKSGYVVNDQGGRLTGYPADSAGNITASSPQDLRINTSDISPVATGSSIGGAFKGILANLNLDSRELVPATSITSTRLLGSAPPNLTINAANDSLTLTIDGVAQAIPLTQGVYASTAALAAQVQTDINAVLGAGAAQVQVNGGALSLALPNTLTLGIAGNAQPDLFGAAPTNSSTAAGMQTPDPASYNFSSGLTIFDTLGNPHTMTLYFRKAAGPGDWDVYTNVDGTRMSNVTVNGAVQPVTINFNTSGQLTSTMPLNISVDLNSVATDLATTGLNRPNNAATPLDFDFDFTGTTQFGSTFGVNRLEQDGYTAGRLAGVSVGNDGVMQGRYSNGQTRALGQVVLANFTNPNGLQPLGGNQWGETSGSGQPLIGAPSSGSLGVIQSAATEDSNVDLTSELVNMITQQRNYQASAQSIRTQDQLLNTLVNLR